MFRAAAASATTSSARASSLHLLRQEVPCHRHRLAAAAVVGQRAYSDQPSDASKEKAKKSAKKAKQADASSSASSTAASTAPAKAKANRTQFAANPSNRSRVPLSVSSDLDAPFQSPFSAYQSPTSWDPNEDTGMALADPAQARLQEQRLRKAFEQPRRYVAMVVDVDSLKPPLDLMQHGYEGGHAWHQRCIKRIRAHLGVPPHHELDVRMYLFANQTGLSTWYDRHHDLPPRVFFEFCRGVTEAGPITIFTDAGRKDQAADQKVKAFMTDCLMDPSLIHLYLGGLNDYGYVPELTALRTMKLLDKVSLLFLPGPALTSRHYGEYQKRVILWTDCFEELGNQKKDLRWKASEIAAATWHRATQMLPQVDPVSGKFSPDQAAAPFSTLAGAPPSDSSSSSTEVTPSNSPVPSSLNMPDSWVKFIYLQLRYLYPENARAELRARDPTGTGAGYGYGFSSDRSPGSLRDGNANADADADVRARAKLPENNMLNVPGARDFSEERGGYKKALKDVASEDKAVDKTYDARLPESEARALKYKYERKSREKK